MNKMKKNFICSVFLGLVFLLSCGDSSEGTETDELATQVPSHPETFDEKLNELCDCFEEAGDEPKSKMKCFELQNKHHQSTEESRKSEFLEKSNLCIDQ